MKFTVSVIEKEDITEAAMKIQDVAGDIFENYFYNPECMSEEEAENETGHAMNVWTDEDAYKLAVNFAADIAEGNSVKRGDVLDALRGAGYAF